MAEDIDKLIEWLKAQAASRREALFRAAPLDRGAIQDDAALVEEAASELRSLKCLRSRISELEAEREKLRGAIRAIQTATVEGRVCDDVAWFSSIETLHDFCATVLESSTDQLDMLAASPTAAEAEAVGGGLPPHYAVSEYITVISDLDKEAADELASGLLFDITSPFVLRERGAVSCKSDKRSALDAGIAEINAKHGEGSVRRASDEELTELQRERGAVSGQGGIVPSCALKGTGPAASDDVVDEIGRSMDVQYAIGAIINNEGTFFDGRGESMDRLVRAVLSSPPVREIVGALSGLLEAYEGISKNGHAAELRARSILSRFQSVGGEKHDHADGTSAEAVEKVTQPG